MKHLLLVGLFLGFTMPGYSEVQDFDSLLTEVLQENGYEKYSLDQLKKLSRFEKWREKAIFEGKVATLCSAETLSLGFIVSANAVLHSPAVIVEGALNTINLTTDTLLNEEPFDEYELQMLSNKVGLGSLKRLFTVDVPSYMEKDSICVKTLKKYYSLKQVLSVLNSRMAN